MKKPCLQLAAAALVIGLVVVAASPGPVSARRRKVVATEIADLRVTFPSATVDRVSGRLTSASDKCVKDRLVVVSHPSCDGCGQGTSAVDGSFSIDTPIASSAGAVPYDVEVTERRRNRVKCLAASERTFAARAPDGVG